MAVSPLQNFYKEQIAIACGAGAENIYVSTKPVPTNGFLVISPGSESLREIIKYTGTGTDGDGDYVTVANIADRGLGGTTAQAHEVGEPIRMNYTAEHQKEIDDTIEAIVAGGTPDASTTVKGRAKLSVAPADAAEPIAVGDNDTRLPSADLQAAQAGGGDFGAPSEDNKFLTEESVVSESVFLSPTMQIFTSSGTYTKPVGVKRLIIEAVGAGAGGQSSGTSNGNGRRGGGGGGYVKKQMLTADVTDTVDVTIGTGGTGGAGSNGVGTSGGNTTFGAYLTAGGGNGNGEGGTATGGDINIKGESKADRPASDTESTQGGASILGYGGKGSFGGSSTGQNYGGGGSGGFRNTVTVSGGAGAPGIVIVTEYYS